MSIKIEQIAIAVPDIEATIAQLNSVMGETEWHHDTVETIGYVGDAAPGVTRAQLAFNYDIIPGIELELIKYLDGRSWHDFRKRHDGSPFLSHFGLHLGDDTFEPFISMMLAKNMDIIQRVRTTSHTNENIKDTRRYDYVIFDTWRMLGFDLKIIRRNLLAVGS